MKRLLNIQILFFCFSCSKSLVCGNLSPPNLVTKLISVRNNFPSARNHIPSIGRSLNWIKSKGTFHANNKSFDGGPDFEDGEDEFDRLERVKREVEPRLGGYRPWSVDTSSRRPGEYSCTSKIVLANVIMYGMQMIFPVVTRIGAKRSDMIMQGKQLYRLITPVFLHGSFSHILMNSFSLQNIGPEVEKLFGSGRFLATYLAAGIAGNFASAYYTPNPSLGASGAVFGLMGAYYTFLSTNAEFFGQSGQTMKGRMSSTLMMNIVFGLSNSSIDNWAHIGGGAAGAVMASTFGPKLSLMVLPSGGRIVVDKPAIRLPPYLETIPSTINKRLRRGRLRMQVHRYQSELSAKPWRRKRRHQPRKFRREHAKPRYDG